MRSGLPPHVFACVALCVTTAGAQPDGEQAPPVTATAPPPEAGAKAGATSTMTGAAR